MKLNLSFTGQHKWKPKKSLVILKDKKNMAFSSTHKKYKDYHEVMWTRESYGTLTPGINDKSWHGISAHDVHGVTSLLSCH